MNYIERARAELWRALADVLPAAGMVWDPMEQPGLFDLYTLLLLTFGENVESRHVHDAWSVYTMGSRPRHQSIVPFENLSAEVAAYADPFRDAIRLAAKNLR